MYRIVLVDDEAEVRDSMTEGIDWESLGFEVKGVACNGLEAWNLIETEEPDLVMTDIKMPYMDGLELSERIRRKYDDMKIVIFSGYDDFSYAREAIRYKVENYIMKPVNSRELEESMREIRKNLDEERDSFRNFQKLKERYATGVPRIMESILHQVIRGEVDDEVKQSLAENMPDFLMSGGWTVAVAVICDADNTELDDLKYKGIEDELRKKYRIAAVRENRRIDIIFTETNEETVINALENLTRDMKHLFNLGILSGVGCHAETLGDISRSFNEACIALKEFDGQCGKTAYYGDVLANSQKGEKSVVQKAMEYIRENYSDEKLSVETVADEVGFSHSYFSSIFKKETGEACSNYITKVRMEAAAKLLSETDSKTYVIAKDTGYSDVAYFSYAFKHHFGVAPTKYRKANYV